MTLFLFVHNRRMKMFEILTVRKTLNHSISSREDYSKKMANR